MFSKYRLVESKDYLLQQHQIASLQREVELAAQIIRSLSEGRSTAIQWPEDGSIESALLQELKNLKEKLAHIGEEERQRNWSSEGLALFGHLLRNHESNLEKLGDTVLAKLVSYVNANQGAIFLQEEQQGKSVLKQIACYAYNRKKFLEKTIHIGEGLIGQTFLERETTFLTDVPQGYTTITSGLGEETPTSLVLIPLKYNDKMMGVMELASFSIFPPYAIEFLEKVGEAIGAAVSNVRIAEQTQQLLQETQIQAEQMRSQEEEMRQSLEELQATQEEMTRKQIQVDQKGQLLQLILDNIPLPTFVKDQNGCYTLVNKAEIALLGASETDIIGKDDSQFTNDPQEIAEIKKSDASALASLEPIELPAQHFSTPNGKHYIFKTTKVSFRNSITGERNIIGVSVDLTDKIQLERKLEMEKSLRQGTTLVDLLGRQRMLSQKIGFHTEIVARGEVRYIETLKQAIELYQHSLDVIKHGGNPKGIETDVPLPAMPVYLQPLMVEAEEMWLHYKSAVEDILMSTNSAQAIGTIEEIGEKLLQLNNQMVVQYKKELHLEKVPQMA